MPVLRKRGAAAKKKPALKKKKVKQATKKSGGKSSSAKKLGGFTLTKEFDENAGVDQIAELMDLPTGHIELFFLALRDMAVKELRESEKLMLPGLCAIKFTKIEAKPKREGVNPFTKEPCEFKAVPAGAKLKVTALHCLSRALNHEMRLPPKDTPVKKSVIVKLAKDCSVEEAMIREFLSLLEIVGHAEIYQSGAFALPGFGKLVLETLKAVPERKGVNQFTKQECVFKGRPAMKSVILEAHKSVLRDLMKEVKVESEPTEKTLSGGADLDHTMAEGAGASSSSGVNNLNDKGDASDDDVMIVDAPIRLADVVEEKIHQNAFS